MLQKFLEDELFAEQLPGSELIGGQGTSDRLFLHLQFKREEVQFKYFQMQALVQNTTIKLAIQHNISSLKVIEARYDLNQSILSVKENIEMRFGSVVSFTRLQLKDPKGVLLAEMNEDMRTLGSYGAATGMVLYVIDLNPCSIHKEIQSFEGVEKYVISEEDYNNLPENFRKWKQNQMKNNPKLFEQKPAVATGHLDPDYMCELASTISLGSRCKIQSGARGQVAFVGRVVDLGAGFYVGVVLDQPYGNSDGKVKGVKYFQAQDKYAIFVRPNALQIGDFPVLDLDDEL